MCCLNKRKIDQKKKRKKNFEKYYGIHVLKTHIWMLMLDGKYVTE